MDNTTVDLKLIQFEVVERILLVQNMEP